MVRSTIPPTVSARPSPVFHERGSAANRMPITAPNKGDVNAIGITRVRGAPLSAV